MYAQGLIYARQALPPTSPVLGGADAQLVTWQTASVVKLPGSAEWLRVVLMFLTSIPPPADECVVWIPPCKKVEMET